MPNKLDARIERIREEIIPCLTRLIVAVELHARPKTKSTADMRAVVREAGRDPQRRLDEILKGGAGLYYGWIGEALIKITTSLSEIDTDSVLAGRKHGKVPAEIFQKHIDEALYQIEMNPGGILASVDHFFGETGGQRPSATSLNLLHEIVGKAKIIRRRLKILKQPALGWLLSYRLAGALVVCGLIAAPIFYATRAQKTSPDLPTSQSVQTQLKADKVAIANTIAAPNKNPIEKGWAIAEYASKALTALPSIFLGLSLFVALIDYVFVTQRWRHRGIDGIRQDLVSASEAVKGLVGK